MNVSFLSTLSNNVFYHGLPSLYPPVRTCVRPAVPPAIQSACISKYCHVSYVVCGQYVVRHTRGYTESLPDRTRDERKPPPKSARIQNFHSVCDQDSQYLYINVYIEYTLFSHNTQSIHECSNKHLTLFDVFFNFSF